MHTAVLNTDARAQRPALEQLLRNSSIELTSNGLETIRAAAEILPFGMSVYVPKLPRQTLEDKLVQLGHLRDFGLEPVPHIAARQLVSEEELRGFVTAAVERAGARRALVIGGDIPDPAGPFPDSASVIETGLLKDSGIEVIDVAGYPEKHPRIPRETLRADLGRKIRLADEQGFRLNIVTQFCFEPGRMVTYCNWLAREAPGIPVYAGMAGPTGTRQLLRYAKICGVGTSLRAVNSLGVKAVKLAMHAGPERHFSELSEHMSRGEAGNLAGVHLFSFGGFVDSARWVGRLAAETAL